MKEIIEDSEDDIMKRIKEIQSLKHKINPEALKESPNQQKKVSVARKTVISKSPKIILKNFDEEKDSEGPLKEFQSNNYNEEKIIEINSNSSDMIEMAEENNSSNTKPYFINNFQTDESKRLKNNSQEISYSSQNLSKLFDDFPKKDQISPIKIKKTPSNENSNLASKKALQQSRNNEEIIKRLRSNPLTDDFYNQKSSRFTKIIQLDLNGISESKNGQNKHKFPNIKPFEPIVANKFSNGNSKKFYKPKAYSIKPEAKKEHSKNIKIERSNPEKINIEEENYNKIENKTEIESNSKKSFDFKNDYESIQKTANRIMKAHQQREAVFIQTKPSANSIKDGSNHSDINYTSNDDIIYSGKKSCAIDDEKVLLSTSKEHEDDFEQVDSEDFLKKSFYEDFFMINPFSESKFTIPNSFSSYSEYSSIFDSLRRDDIRASISSSISEKHKIYEGLVDCVESLKIATRECDFAEDDLILVSIDSNIDFYYYSQAILNGTVLNKNSKVFIAIIENISYPQPKQFSSKAIIHLISSEDIPFLSVSQKLYFRFVQNIITYKREFAALLQLKSSSLLQYILDPISYSVKKDSEAIQPLSKNDSLVPKNKKDLINKLVQVQNLNLIQSIAVANTYFSSDKFILIQGPPGTGKTTVILSILSVFLYYKTIESSLIYSPKFLICAPSNAAIDEVIIRLSKGIKDFNNKKNTVSCVRIGASNSKEVEQFTLEHLSSKDNIFNKYKRKQMIISASNVICSTLSSSAIDILNNVTFDYLIIDEACQATELSTLVPLNYNYKKIIMIGDPKQLPPTVFSNNKALEYTLFERLSAAFTPILLDTQYRMQKSICALSSDNFYSGKLITAENIKFDNSFQFKPTYFCNITNIKEEMDSYKSYYNETEARISYEIAHELEKKYKSKVVINILTPYKAQRNKINELKDQGDTFEVSTIDACQGKEVDVVILSTVRQKRLGFTDDMRRINVAITRAKMCIIILGNQNILDNNEQWKRIIQSINTNSSEKYTQHNYKKLIESL